MVTVDRLVESAADEAGSGDFGGDDLREGLERLVEALTQEADLNELGETITEERVKRLLVNRLRIEQTYRDHPEIDTQAVEGPLVLLGLPRTGTTALSQLVAADPQIRSVRLWESSEPVPPPEEATQHRDPRIDRTREGLDMMYETFPRMRSLYFQTATGATECQDLLGMSFRTMHFDGLARVPSYTSWARDCDMAPAYAYHHRTLKLLQSRCPPRLWHLKTPVHLLSLDALVTEYPYARFLWTHRDPSEVLGSVCDLIAYTRSWVSDRDDAEELGAQQLDIWTEAMTRGIEVRERLGDERFADIPFDRLNADPVGAVEEAYDHLGLSLSDDARAAMRRWAVENPRGGRGVHEYALADFGITPDEVRGRFGFYLDRFEVPTGT